MAIKDKVVSITVASSGIGAATAELLAKRGAKLVLAARREEKLKAVAENIQSVGAEVIYQVTDVTKKTDNQKLVDQAIEVYGKVDVIFLNAGLMPNSPLSSLKSDEWDQMVDVNIKGVLNGIQAILPKFTAQKSGHVITTSSVAGLKAYPGGAVYGATKWAVRDLMEVLRMESAQEGTNIRTATIYPAAIHSELIEKISDQETARNFNKMYDQYEISPERVANVV